MGNRPPPQTPEKEFQLAQAIAEIAAARATGKIEIDFKDGVLTGGRKILPLFK